MVSLKVLLVAVIAVPAVLAGDPGPFHFSECAVNCVASVVAGGLCDPVVVGCCNELHEKYRTCFSGNRCKGADDAVRFMDKFCPGYKPTAQVTITHTKTMGSTGPVTPGFPKPFPTHSISYPPGFSPPVPQTSQKSVSVPQISVSVPQVPKISTSVTHMPGHQPPPGDPLESLHGRAIHPTEPAPAPATVTVTTCATGGSVVVPPSSAPTPPPVAPTPAVPPPVVSTLAVPPPVVSTPAVPPLVVSTPAVPPPFVSTPEVPPPVVSTPAVPPPEVSTPAVPPPVGSTDTGIVTTAVTSVELTTVTPVTSDSTITETTVVTSTPATQPPTATPSVPVPGAATSLHAMEISLLVLVAAVLVV